VQDFVEKIGQNFQMSHYMWRNYKQKQTKFTLEAIHIQPNVPQEAIECFMFQMLGAYSEAIRLIFPNMNPVTETPILLCRDFNMDIMQNKSFVNFMKSRFNLDCISSASTTLGNTCQI
jgi:hypothetical protein